MKEDEPIIENNKFTFTPCKYCSNILTKECFEDCIHEGEYKHFRLRPGTGIKDLPGFPISEILDFPDPRFRLVVISIYISAITDYLQHEDEYKFREKAQGKETKVPDLKLNDGREVHGLNNDPKESGRMSENR